MGQVRLQKYLAECGVASRRNCEELIREGRVRVNGDLVTELGTKVTPGTDRVTLNRKPVLPNELGLILLNKPRSVLSTTHDPGGRRTVKELLPKGYAGYVPVGRLDFDSTGLVLLTNDGELAHRLLHPKFGWPRVYEVKVSGFLDERMLGRLRRGVKLEDGVVRAEVEVLRTGNDSTWLRVSIGVGRNRILRRLFEHLRRPVLKLHRVKHGPLSIGKLRVGGIRILPPSEYERVRGFIFEKSAVQLKQAKKTSQKKTQRRR